VRLDYTEIFPTGYRAMLTLDGAARQSTLEPALLELVRLRASQLNGCAFCLDMHATDARALGEAQQRLDVLAAWREASLYSARERAALAWCEAITLLADSGAPDATYEQLVACFTPEETVALTIAIVAINGWNRLAVGFRSPVANHVPPLPGSTPSTGAPISSGEAK
jgi:AhpD family alkylhydroperoxidase